MIQYTQGNFLEADVEALVNTVNTVGVMGKGIALMFKDRFPQIPPPKKKPMISQPSKHRYLMLPSKGSFSMMKKSYRKGFGSA